MLAKGCQSGFVLLNFGMAAILRVLAASLLVAGFAVRAADAPPLSLERLAPEIERIAAESGGSLGVGVRHLESRAEWYRDPAGRFPMGSVFKIPVALQLLSLVDAGKLDLERMVTVQPSDLRPGSGHLAKWYRGPTEHSVRALLEVMMIHSDNTATDLLWREAGGAEGVRARLRALGVDGISVDRPTGPLLAASNGFGELAPDADMTPAGFDELGRRIPRGKRIPGFLKDPRDTTTPKALVELLDRLWRGEALSAERTALLVDIMARCATGKARLPAGLPAGTRLAHKTGTLRPHVVNDAGIVTLPGGAGHVAIVVLVREGTLDLAGKERAIASVARAVYGHFVPVAGQ